MPPHSRQFVFMRKVVVHFAAECLLEGLPKTLRKVLGSSRQNKCIDIRAFPFHYSSQRIILRCARCFISEQLLNLIAMCCKEISVHVNKSLWYASALLFAGRAHGDFSRLPVLPALAVSGRCFWRRPAPIQVNRSTRATDLWLVGGPWSTVSAGLMIQSLSKSDISKGFFVRHGFLSGRENLITSPLLLRTDSLDCPLRLRQATNVPSEPLIG